MENLSFSNIQDYVTKAVVTKAKKLFARDSELVSPGKIIAYVDQGKETYDVAIEFDKEKIKSLSCDCEKGISFCVHKMVLINLIKNKKSEKVISVKRKKTDSDLILEGLDEVTLRIWVQELFKKNKDFELLFVSEFSKTEIIFGEKEVKIIIDKAIKSVIKNKKSVDATELKRIIEILDVSLQPVLRYCKANIALAETNELLVYIYSELLEFNYQKNISGVKLVRFIEKLYKENNHFILNIKDKEQWEVIVKQTILFILNKKIFYELEMDVVYHLYESIAENDRKTFFAQVLFDVFNINIDKKVRFVIKIEQFFLKAFAENKLFEIVYLHFLPIRYENEYNVFLIEKLIEIEKLKLAENIAYQQISTNYNEKYNVPYFNVLKNIYEISKDEKKIAFLNMKTIFYDFSLEAYKLIEKHCEEKEFKIFRTNLLAHFKSNFYNTPKCVTGYYEILYYDKKYQKLIDNISEFTLYELVYNYKEQLFLFDKVAFLLALTKIERNSYYSYKSGGQTLEFRDKFIIWIKENYDAKTLDSIFIDKPQYYAHEFLEDLKTQLK